jgi:peptidoglycan/xylan/chitin deacetylase (PgdA/CDA1 family)
MFIRKSIFCFIAATTIIVTGCKEDPVPADKGRIIVLLYHRITEEVPSNLYERSVTDFESDIKYLINNNIKVISFDDLSGIRESGTMPEGHSAIISFDDGDRSGYDLALPVLRKYQIKATFFLWVEKIDQNSYFTSSEVGLISNYMLPGGTRPFTFGSHSYTHQYLLTRKATFTTDEEYNLFLDYELGESKRIIELLTPNDVKGLALPFGDGAGDSEIIAAAQRNGYSFVRTSVHSAIKDPDIDLFSIPSVPILNNTLVEEIGYYLEN